MKPKKLRICSVLALMLLTACAGVQPTARGPESGSSEKALWQRADTYWQNKIKLQLDKTYPLETPSYRRQISLTRYARGYPGEVMYQKATIKSVKIDGDHGLVEVEIRYRYMGAFSPRGGIRTTLISHWTLVDGQWYHLIRPPAPNKGR